MGSVQAKAYHSITIGDKNTWDDWHLVPTSRPKFAMPPVKTSYVDVPGGDGVLDLSTALTGRPTYGNRQGSFEFLVIGSSADGTLTYGEWYDRYSEIATYLHGQQFNAVLDDDPTYYYEGRFSVNEWKSEAHYSKIVINYNVGPYKKSSISVAERWLWDPFFFGNPNNPSDKGDTIYTYKNMSVKSGETLTINYIGDIFQDTPVIVCTKNGNTTFSLGITITNESGTKSRNFSSPGTYVLDGFKFYKGNNTVKFTGSAIVTIKNTGGRL